MFLHSGGQESSVSAGHRLPVCLPQVQGALNPLCCWPAQRKGVPQCCVRNEEGLMSLCFNCEEVALHFEAEALDQVLGSH